MGIPNPDLAGIDAQDLPGGVAELENIPGHTLNGEVFIDRADERFAGLQHHAVIGIIGNGAAGSQRHQSTATASAHAMVHGVVMNESGAAATLGAEAFREHSENVI